MRITNTTIARNYTSNLNRNLGRLSDSNMQVATNGRKIFKMSDDTATGVRAMNIRRSLGLLEGYTDNAKSMKNKIDTADKAIGQIAEIATSVYERFNFGLNGTNNDDERGIIANEFKKLQEELLTSANGQYSDRYLFGGTNTVSAPFTKSDDGKLMYNGVIVSEITDDPQFDYLRSDAAYADIGLGMSMIGTSQQVNTNSALQSTINGLNFMGTGETNMYDTISSIINVLESPGTFDRDKADKLLNQIKDCSNNATLERTRIGADSQYLEYTVSRLETEHDSLIERQDTLEFRDPSEAIMDYSMQEYVYNAALQMGSRLLQPTIFSFIS